jgi:hypothetical protein
LPEGEVVYGPEPLEIEEDEVEIFVAEFDMIDVVKHFPTKK